MSNQIVSMPPVQGRRLRLVVSAAVVALLSLSCDAAEPAGPEPVPPGTARVSGQILDELAQPVANVAIQVPFGDQRIYQIMTGNDGRYTMNLPVANFANVSPVVMFAKRDGYRPFAAWFTRIEEGSSYNFGTTDQHPLQTLEIGEFSPSTNLVHVGDDNFGGSENSQLQMASRGTYQPLRLTDWTSLLATSRSATIFFIGRGIQTSICPGNGIGLVNSAGHLTEAAPYDSDVLGGFTSYALTVDVPATNAGQEMYVFVASGQCSSSDHDDFEVGSIFVHFDL